MKLNISFFSNYTMYMSLAHSRCPIIVFNECIFTIEWLTLSYNTMNSWNILIISHLALYHWHLTHFWIHRIPLMMLFEVNWFVLWINILRNRSRKTLIYKCTKFSPLNKHHNIFFKLIVHIIKSTKKQHITELVANTILMSLGCHSPFLKAQCPLNWCFKWLWD